MPTFCALGTVSAFSSLAGTAAASARFSLVDATELLFSSVSSSFSSLGEEPGRGLHSDGGARSSDTHPGTDGQSATEPAPQRCPPAPRDD